MTTDENEHPDDPCMALATLAPEFTAAWQADSDALDDDVLAAALEVARLLERGRDLDRQLVEACAGKDIPPGLLDGWALNTWQEVAVVLNRAHDGRVPFASDEDEVADLHRQAQNVAEVHSALPIELVVAAIEMDTMPDRSTAAIVDGWRMEAEVA